MRKNGSRLISVTQYKTTDLVIFAALLIVSEVLGHYAMKWFSGSAFFTLSLAVPLTCLVMARWGWWSVFCPAISGVTYCLLNNLGVSHYAVYCLGGMFIMLMLIPCKLIGVEKIRKKWYFTALFALGAWLCSYLGKSLVWMIAFAISPVEGSTLYAGFTAFALYDSLSAAMSVILLLVMRKLDGMFEDQVAYLKRLDKERRDRMKYDSFGDEPVEIDEEALSVLHRDNDLYE